MSDIDLDDIRRLDGGLLLVFRELLRRRRATAAAKALGLSQSAISHALGRLRDLFGDPLFVRRPHGLEPTARALALGPRIEELIDLAGAALKREGAFDPTTSTRRFMLAAPEFVTAQIGASLLNTLRTEAPGVSFIALNMSQEAALQALMQGRIDLALGRFAGARPGFDIEVLLEDRYCVVARRGHPTFKTRISERAYEQAGHVFSFSPGEGGDAEDEGASVGIVTRAVVARWLTALVLVSASDAIATVPRKLAESQAGVLGLTILRAPFVGDSVTISAVRRSGIVDDGADWFLGLVRDALR